MLTHTIPTVWLLTMEAQDNPWIGTLSHMSKVLYILSDHHHEDMDNFKNVEHENHTTLKALTRNLDDLQHRVETAEVQCMEAINHL